MSANVDRLKEKLPPDVPFLAKPFSNQELLTALREVLRHYSSV